MYHIFDFMRYTKVSPIADYICIRAISLTDNTQQCSLVLVFVRFKLTSLRTVLHYLGSTSGVGDFHESGGTGPEDIG